MSALSIQPTYPIFTETDGLPLENGYIWIGTVNLDPQVNPINVYFDAALTILAAQPIRTINGYPSNNGTPARLYVNSDYSIRVMNKNGSAVYSAPAATERYSPIVFGGNAEQVIYDPPFANAVQTNVEAKLAQTVSVKDFGAVGDGVTDDATAVRNWLEYLVANNKSGFVPAGVYLLGSKIAITNVDKLGIYGEGSCLSMFKRADNVVTSSFTEMFSFANKSGGGSQLVVKGISLDGNARGNQIPVDVSNVVGTFQVGEQLVGKEDTIGTVSANQLKFTRYLNGTTTGEVITGATSGATATVVTGVNPFVWQQSHCIRTLPTQVLGWDLVTYDDVWATDPTADVFGLGGDATLTYGTISVSNLVVKERNRVRSDITVTGSYDNLKIVNCKTTVIEVETNTFNANQAHDTVITNLITDNLDLYAKTANDTTGWPQLLVSNVIVNKNAVIGSYTGSFINVNFFLAISGLRLIEGKWSFSDCNFFARSTFNSTQGVVFQEGNGSNARAANFNNCTFEAESGATLPYYYFDNNAWGSGSTALFCTPFVFNNCKFKGSSVRTAFLRGGKFEFSRCTHEYAGDAILYSTPSVADSEIKLFDNVVTDAAGYLVTPPITFTAPATGLNLWMRDNVSETLGQIINFTRYDKIAPPHGAAVGANAVLYFKQVDRQYESDAEPTTGKWLKGSVVWNSAPAPSGKVGWSVTTSGTAGSGAVFKPFGVIDA